MSLLKWKELAKSKTKLGNKINYVHNLITQHKIGENTSQESFAKVFKPVTSKLDDVIVSNLISKTPQRRRPRKKVEVPNYGIDIEDEDEDINLGDLFDEQPVPPQQEKQMEPVPPPYEEFYIDPEYYQTKQKYPYPKEETPKNIPAYIPFDPTNYDLPNDDQPNDDLLDDDPPDYDEDQPLEFVINPDLERIVLDSYEINLPNYESVQESLNQVADTNKRKIMVLNRYIKNAQKKRQQIRGYKSHNTKQNKINNPDIWEKNKRKFNIQDIVLKRYINNLTDQKIKVTKGSGIRGRGIIKKMEKDRNRIKGYKAYVTKRYNSGVISEAERQIMNKQLDNKLAELNKYIKDHKKKIKGRRRKQRGGNVMFFNDVKQLLNKLELIIGEVIAGNTSIQMRNTGVNILDTLLRMSTINKPQYNKLYKKYFKV